MHLVKTSYPTSYILLDFQLLKISDKLQYIIYFENKTFTVNSSQWETLLRPYQHYVIGR